VESNNSACYREKKKKKGGGGEKIYLKEGLGSYIFVPVPHPGKGETKIHGKKASGLPMKCKRRESVRRRIITGDKTGNFLRRGRCKLGAKNVGTGLNADCVSMIIGRSKLVGTRNEIIFRRATD